MNLGEELTVTRLYKDYMHLKANPVPYFYVEPLPEDVYEWHFVFRGPKDTPYEGGFYHGVIFFPDWFPSKDPYIYMITPNGRIKHDTRLCLSLSNRYKDKLWNPLWSVRMILYAILYVMLDVDAPSTDYCELWTSDEDKMSLAVQSIDFNMKNDFFIELFPHIVEVMLSGFEKYEVEMIEESQEYEGSEEYEESQESEESVASTITLTKNSWSVVSVVYNLLSINMVGDVLHRFIKALFDFSLKGRNSGGKELEKQNL